jgi:hypothetical protein
MLQAWKMDVVENQVNSWHKTIFIEISRETYHIKHVLANSDKLITRNMFNKETQTNLSHKTSIMGKLR